LKIGQYLMKSYKTYKKVCQIFGPPCIFVTYTHTVLTIFGV